MPFLALLGPVKNILMNPKVLIGLAIAGLLAYHYFTVTGLEKDNAILEANNVKVKAVLEVSNNTIKKMTKDIDQVKRTRNISDNSYIEEITSLKALIFELEKRQVFTEVIKIKTVKVPVIVKGETIYVDKCKDIKVKRLDNNDSENSIIRILSGVGK